MCVCVCVCVCVWHEHLGYFHILVIVNSTAINIGMHVSFELMFSFFLGIYRGMELLDYLVVLIWVFWRTAMLFSIVAAPVCISTNHLVLAYCMFLEICPILPDCPICWYIILTSIILQYFVSLLYQLLFLLFHFLFCLIWSCFCWQIRLKVFQFCLLFQKLRSWFH